MPIQVSIQYQKIILASAMVLMLQIEQLPAFIKEFFIFRTTHNRVKHFYQDRGNTW